MPAHLPNDYTVKEIKEIWGVRCTPSPPRPNSIILRTCLPPLTLARGKHANLSKMSPLERGKTLVKTSTEYIVFGDFVCLEPYVFATTAYWVPLATIVKDVTRTKAELEIEIFEGNLARWPRCARTRWRNSRRRSSSRRWTSGWPGRLLRSLYTSSKKRSL